MAKTRRINQEESDDYAVSREQPQTKSLPSDAKYIGFSEAARLINRSPQTVRRWALEGLIKTIREPTGRLRIIRSDLDQFLKATNIKVSDG